MINFLNRHKILFLVFAFLFFIGFIFLTFNNGNKNNQLPNGTASNNLWSFQPGITTKNEVIKQLGDPILEVKQNNQTIDDFKSNSATRNNQVVFQNDKSQFFKQIVAAGENIKISDIANQYGPTDNILYGRDAESGFYLYVYLNKGVAYLGNSETQDILEIWYFQPTNIDNFIQLWASNYSKTLPTKQGEF